MISIYYNIYSSERAKNTKTFQQQNVFHKYSTKYLSKSASSVNLTAPNKEFSNVNSALCVYANKFISQAICYLFFEKMLLYLVLNIDR